MRLCPTLTTFQKIIKCSHRSRQGNLNLVPRLCCKVNAMPPNLTNALAVQSSEFLRSMFRMSGRQPNSQRSALHPLILLHDPMLLPAHQLLSFSSGPSSSHHLLQSLSHSRNPAHRMTRNTTIPSPSAMSLTSRWRCSCNGTTSRAPGRRAPCGRKSSAAALI